MRLAHEFGLWDQPGVTMAAPDPASDADLRHASGFSAYNDPAIAMAWLLAQGASASPTWKLTPITGQRAHHALGASGGDLLMCPLGCFSRPLGSRAASAAMA
jgi:hypothetical protein